MFGADFQCERHLAIRTQLQKEDVMSMEPSTTVKFSGAGGGSPGLSTWVGQEFKFLALDHTMRLQNHDHWHLMAPYVAWAS